MRSALASLPPADVLPLDQGYLVVRRRSGAPTQRYAAQLQGVRKLVRVRRWLPPAGSFSPRRRRSRALGSWVTALGSCPQAFTRPPHHASALPPSQLRLLLRERPAEHRLTAVLAAAQAVRSPLLPAWAGATH